MLYKRCRRAFIALCIGSTCTSVWALSIPGPELDRRHIYMGNPEEFTSPAEVDYSAVVHKTPEYQEILSAKLERGSGKYWILLSQASDKALIAIAKSAEAAEYDLIAEKGYLGSLEKPIACPDITDSVISKLD